MKNKEVKNNIKSKLNNTFPMVIVLSIVCVMLLVYIYAHKNDDTIHLGTVSTEEVIVNNIHYFKNDKVNYFYASPASYSGEDKTIYTFVIGYYVENSKGELVPFVTRRERVQKGESLKKIVEEMSAWNFMELETAHNYFTKEVNPYLHKLHFVVKASTDAENDKYDVEIDNKVSLDKML